MTGASGRELPARDTPLSLDAAREAFRHGWRGVVGEYPDYGQLCLVLAHCGLETGGFTRIRCYNFGGVKAGDGYRGDYQFFPTHEVVSVAAATRMASMQTEAAPVVIVKVDKDANKAVIRLLPKHPSCKFRAYESAAEGAAAHVAFLAKTARYALAWKKLQDVDVERYAHELRAAGYYTAPEEEYDAAVKRNFTKYGLKLLGYDNSDPEIRRFQSNMGLVVDGIAGPRTRAKIVERLRGTT